MPERMNNDLLLFKKNEILKLNFLNELTSKNNYFKPLFIIIK
jgi:hypothetical protein